MLYRLPQVHSQIIVYEQPLYLLYKFHLLQGISHTQHQYAAQEAQCVTLEQACLWHAVQRPSTVDVTQTC